MGMPGPFEWLVLIGIALLVGGTLRQRQVRRRESQVRGFEVKPTADVAQPASPALRERDDHHG